MTNDSKTTDTEGPLSPLGKLRRKEREIDDEIEFHLEMEEDKLRAQGLSPEEARRQARLSFGGQQKWREEVRDVDGIGPFERLVADLRFGLRVLRRSPVFTIVAVLTLALGIGASTAIFSVVDGILLRALPYSEPDELVTFWADYSGRGGPVREWWDFPTFNDLRTATAESAGADQTQESGRVFEELALWNQWNPTLTGTDDAAQQLQGAVVSHGMLSKVLRVAPVHGSLFSASDDTPGAPPTVVISERLWAQNFGSDPAITSKSLTLNGMEFAVLGVLPADFRQPLLPRADIWRALQWDETNHGGSRGSAIVRSLGRLSDGTSLAVAQTRLEQEAKTLEQEYPEQLTGISAVAFPLKEDVVAGPKSGLLMLLAAVVATLLIVCINLANLLLARGAARQREFSLRTALGASSLRLARQLLTESLLLAGLGGALGVALAVAGTQLLVSLAPSGTPRIAEVGIDLRVLLFCAGVTLLCGLIFGLLPALQAARARLASRIGRHREGNERISELLVAAQVAAALVLLIGAGLLLQSFSRLAATQLGFEPDGLVNVQMIASNARFPELEQAVQYLDQAEQELISTPGVASVARGDTFPLAGINGDLDYNIEGRDLPRPGEETIAWFRRATPGYFTTLGIEVKQGRSFTSTDDASAPLVVVINETLARRQFSGQNPIGQRLNVNRRDQPRWREIVGVVGDIKNFNLRQDARPALYLPFEQVQSRRASFVLRASSAGPDDVDQLAASIRERMRSFDPDAAPVIQAATTLVESARGVERFVTWLLALFATVAMILAAVGLYGIINYRVNRRTAEIGLRLALGAHGSAVRRWVVSHTLKIAIFGVVTGLVLGYFATRGLRSLLFEIENTDPLTFVGLSVLMVLVAAIAAGLPAWRASRLDPAKVLRAE